MHILMVAAENGALPGFKVGGIADVVHELPPALAAAGCRVSVVCPSYGLLARLGDVRGHGVVETRFRGARTTLPLWRTGNGDAVRHFVLDHALFSACGVGAVYCDDPDGGPFATDASKFALFCAAVAEAVVRGAFGTVDVIHLHDWHAALLLLLRRHHPRCVALRAVRTVFTIHNLALQGVRPLRGHASSLEQWFPRMPYDPALVADPRWPDCVNPMAAAIRLSDAVGTVSPSYAREILEPNAVQVRGLHGGEGLEQDLRAVHARGALSGILNGCDYPQDGPAPHTPPAARDWPQLVALMRAENLRLAGTRGELHSAHFVADARLAALAPERPRTLLVTVGRITAQKLGLLRAAAGDGRSVLDAVLDALGEDGVYLMLGSGEPDLEQFLVAAAARRRGLILVRGYTEVLPDALYAAGDLFLMPSTFEPCGISQMLAMRAGQPCLVHAVGGLKDTVRDGTSGFAFDGASTAEQAGALLARLRAALQMRARHPERWAALRAAAARERFRWSDSAREYLARLYSVGLDARMIEAPAHVPRLPEAST
jgi:starch synthase